MTLKGYGQVTDAVRILIRHANSHFCADNRNADSTYLEGANVVESRAESMESVRLLTKQACLH